MHTGLWVFLGIMALLLAYAVVVYNRLVGLKHAVGKAWSNIDVLLVQRHEELPKLVEVCRQYMRYEQDTLEKVMLARNRVSEARARGDVSALDSAEGVLETMLGRLFAVSEDYPELQANDNFRHLSTRITSLENAIADRREFYNETANLNNIRIEQIPEVLIAQMFDFRPAALLRFRREQTRDVNLNKLFGS